MRVAPCFLGSVAIPMLHHRIDALPTPALSELLMGRRGLETLAIGTGHIGRQLRILTKRSVKAPPAGLGGNVYLR